jgi:hypothetical protein
MPAFNYGLEPSGSSVTIEYLKTEANAPEVKKRSGEAGLETAGSTANGQSEPLRREMKKVRNLSPLERSAPESEPRVSVTGPKSSPGDLLEGVTLSAVGLSRRSDASICSTARMFLRSRKEEVADLVICRRSEPHPPLEIEEEFPHGIF